MNDTLAILVKGWWPQGTSKGPGLKSLPQETRDARADSRSPPAYAADTITCLSFQASHVPTAAAQTAPARRAISA